jgi:hypothetical protein
MPWDQARTCRGLAVPYIAGGLICRRTSFFHQEYLVIH